MNVLFVCTGNTCRSPMAEGYLKSIKADGISVKSRGLMSGGMPASENSVKAMKELGIDIGEHISKQLTPEDIEWADRIICMSNTHAEALEPFAKEKLGVLGEGISDPYGGNIAVYCECRDQIVREVNRLFLSFEVRKALQSDMESIAQLERSCFGTPWSIETLLDAFKNNTCFFVAVSGEKVLGYAGINCAADEGYITNVAVFSEYRNCGVGAAILNAVFDMAKQAKLAFVSLEVRVSNTGAKALYEKLGFKIEGTRPNFYDNPKEDADIMTKRFE